jgi:hypothetical protein
LLNALDRRVEQANGYQGKKELLRQLLSPWPRPLSKGQLNLCVIKESLLQA